MLYQTLHKSCISIKHRVYHSDILHTIDHHLLKLSSKHSHIHSYWIEQLNKINKRVARLLIPQLSPTNALGYLPHTKQEAKKGTLLDFVLQRKIEHPTKIILTRVGEFYETFGVDAILLVQYAGLNPMGGKARAGCPVRNVQATLDCLVSAGYTVAIYEEVNDSDVASSKARIKHRALTQVVSPAASTYLYELCLRGESIDFRESRPVVSVMRTAEGYSMAQIHVDEHCVIVQDRMTEEGLRASLESGGYMEPIYVSTMDSASNANLSTPEVSRVPAFLSTESVSMVTSTGLSSTAFHNLILQKVSATLNIPTSMFREVNRSESSSTYFRPLPLYTSTLNQIGVLSNAFIPPLVPRLLPRNSASYTAKYLTRFLLSPPPYYISDHMRALLQALSEKNSAREGLRNITPVAVGKSVSLLSTEQCNVATFREIALNLHGVLGLLAQGSTDEFVGSKIIPHMLALTSYESGLTTDLEQFTSNLESALELIRTQISMTDCCHTPHSENDPISRDPHQKVPDEFFYRNELEFRGCLVRGINPDVDRAYDAVTASAKILCDAVHQDFTIPSEVTSAHSHQKRVLYTPVYDPVNNIIACKKSVKKSTNRSTENGTNADAVVQTAHISSESSDPVNYYHPLDRYRQQISSRYTSDRVATALSAYLQAASSASNLVTAVLKQLSRDLYSKMTAIIQASHFGVIMQTAVEHAVASKQKGWRLPTITGPGSDLNVEGMWPYWMESMEAIKNDVKLSSGAMLLTAPNMSGKSTLMRATLVTALLGNCGLFVPSISASIPRYDSFFLRTTSFDIPTERKSAFGVEMEDVRVMMRDSTANSLVMIDEIGKGTSSRDGVAIAGALLEWMCSTGLHGIFATHLHELLDIPLNTPGIVLKRMGISKSKFDGLPTWTYTLEDGSCRDSMAFETARAFNVSNLLIERAYELRKVFDTLCRPSFPFSNRDVLTRSPQDTDSEKMYSVDTLRDVVYDIIATNHGANYTIESDVCVVYEESLPSPYMEGCSCVYLLMIRPTATESGDLNPVLYVGETESFTERLSFHRKRLRGVNRTVDKAIAFKVANKSAARAIETRLIRELMTRSYNIENSGDASHTLFGKYSYVS